MIDLYLEKFLNLWLKNTSACYEVRSIDTMGDSHKKIYMLTAKIEVERRHFLSTKKKELEGAFGSSWTEISTQILEFIDILVETKVLRKVKRRELVRILNKLETENYLVPRNYERMLKNLHRDAKRSLHLETINHFSIYPMGSLLHGGARIRIALGDNKPVRDLDIGLFISPQAAFGHNDDSLDNMMDYFTQYMKENDQLVKYIYEWLAKNSKKYQKGGIKVCEQHNPEKFFQDILTVESATVRLISIMNYSSSPGSFESLLAYFRPQYSNTRQKEVMMKALRVLYIGNPKGWENVVNMLVIEWRKVHCIKGKHLLGDDFRENYKPISNNKKISEEKRIRFHYLYKMIHGLEYISGDLLSAPFEEMLRKTSEVKSSQKSRYKKSYDKAFVISKENRY